MEAAVEDLEEGGPQYATRRRHSMEFDVRDVDFALEYRDAIDTLTSDRVADVRMLELDDEEWVLATQLRDVLKVRP